MESQNSQNLAERLIELLQDNEKQADESLLLSLEKINQRLDKIESQITVKDQNSKIQDQKPNHSSQEKFFNLEELALEPRNGFENEKACPFEPAGKPCDHCAMCNSRGF